MVDADHLIWEDQERILEHLAVLKLNPKAEAPILCPSVRPAWANFLGQPTHEPDAHSNDWPRRHADESNCAVTQDAHRARPVAIQRFAVRA